MPHLFKMKRRANYKRQRQIGLLAVVSIAFVYLHPNAFVGAQTCSEGAVCQAQEEDAVESNILQSWFQNVSEAIRKEGNQFLDKVLKPSADSTDGETASSSSTDKRDPFSYLWKTKNERQKQQHAADQEAHSHAKQDENFLEGISSILRSESPSDAFLNLVARSDNDRTKGTLIDLVHTLQSTYKEFTTQFQRAFPKWDLAQHFRPIAAYYYLRVEEERKNAVWKRRQHRFWPKMTDVSALKEYHNALYLSELAYSATVDDIRVGLQKFQNDSWALLYATTNTYKPHEPAHFFAIPKEESPIEKNGGLASILPWEIAGPLTKTPKFASKHQHSAQTDTLEVTLVIRGTKELGDVISDMLFETVDYRNGHRAHGGVLQAGKFLVETHIDRLKELLELSGKKLLRLWCIGHSLGGGAAAIAAIEFNDYDFVEASAIGFGSPSLLSAGLSEAYQDRITTIVSDADIIPRLSAPSMVDCHYRVMSQHVGALMKEDVLGFLHHLRSMMPTKVIDLLQEQLEKMGRSFDERAEVFTVRHQEEMEAYQASRIDEGSLNMDYLEPPGTCIHLFRDGVDYTGAYTPCSFFTEIDFVPTLIEDHLIAPGYHRAMVSLARELTQDLDFQFEHQQLPPT